MNVCGILKNGQNNACPDIIQKRYDQRAVFINKSQIAEVDVDKACDNSTSKYRTKFTLKEGEKGVLFTAPVRGSSIKGWTTPVVDDNGLSYFMHHVQIVMLGVSEEQKCILDSLMKGSFVVALPLTNYTTNSDITQSVEIYGLKNGLVAGDDWEYDITENNGVTLITLSSIEDVGEQDLPYIYESEEAGSELADFEALFENPA